MYWLRAKHRRNTNGLHMIIVLYCAPVGHCATVEHARVLSQYVRNHAQITPHDTRKSRHGLNGDNECTRVQPPYEADEHSDIRWSKHAFASTLRGIHAIYVMFEKEYYH